MPVVELLHVLELQNEPDMINFQNAPVLPATVNTVNNYGYDPLGNLIRDNREKIASITWTVAGKVLTVNHNAGATGMKNLKFGYGAGGHRISKSVYDAVSNNLTERSYYIHDAQGNLMATYQLKGTPTPNRFFLIERPLYGSDRVGMDVKQLEFTGLSSLSLAGVKPDPTGDGELRYELKDHLGNVTTVLTGDLVGVDDSDIDTDFNFKMPKVVEMHGYEPFGSLLPGRQYAATNYRFGFQGQEQDNEVYGSTTNPAQGSSYAFEYRMHDSRVGRFLSLDPLAAKYPHNSPYAFAEGKVIKYVEFEGREAALNSGDANTTRNLSFLPLSDSRYIASQMANTIALSLLHSTFPDRNHFTPLETETIKANLLFDLTVTPVTNRVPGPYGSPVLVNQPVTTYTVSNVRLRSDPIVVRSIVYIKNCGMRPRDEEPYYPPAGSNEPAWYGLVRNGADAVWDVAKDKALDEMKDYVIDKSVDRIGKNLGAGVLLRGFAKTTIGVATDIALDPVEIGMGQGPVENAIVLGCESSISTISAVREKHSDMVAQPSLQVPRFKN